MKKYQFSILLFLATATLMAQSLSGKHHIKYLEINTVQSDYGTTFLEEDRVVFTTPTDDKSKNSQLDLYVGEIGNEGEIVKKERVKGLIGSKISKTGITYSQDKKTVYFSAIPYRKRPRKKDKSQLFSAKVEDTGQWSDVTKLAFNHKNYSLENPSLSKDGKKLYFVSNMPSSIGGKDIFVVNINADGSFGTPVNLGPKVNTSGDEVTPYITQNNILYFSSNGHEGGLGSLDVYASEVFENTVSDPLHLDSPVNSMNDDFAYIVNSKNDRGFFSSNRLQGQNNNDMYAFTIEEDKPEKCLQAITGIVRDKETNEILRDAAITLFDNEGNQIQQVVTDENGAYNLSLDCSNTYTIVAASLHYNKEEHVVNTANYTNAPTLEANKFLVKKADDNVEVVVEEEPEDAYTLNSIYFDFDRADIRVDATSELDKIVAIMKENSSIKVEVSAYTDSRGRSDYNLALSNRRAKSTIDYIVSKGIKRSRLTGKGYGETRMINKCVNGVECSEEAHAKNRRTEFAILNTQAARMPAKTKTLKPEPSSVVTTKDQGSSSTPPIKAKQLEKEADLNSSELITDNETETKSIAKIDKENSEKNTLEITETSSDLTSIEPTEKTEFNDQSAIETTSLEQTASESTTPDQDLTKVSDINSGTKADLSQKALSSGNQAETTAKATETQNLQKELSFGDENKDLLSTNNYQENNKISDQVAGKKQMPEPIEKDQNFLETEEDQMTLAQEDQVKKKRLTRL